MIGRKQLSLYVVANRLALGFELQTSLALASSMFGVSESTLEKSWRAWRKSEKNYPGKTTC